MSYVSVKKTREWTTGSGQTIALADMEESHIVNTIAYLRKKVVAIEGAIVQIELDSVNANKAKMVRGLDRLRDRVLDIDSAVEEFVKELGRRA